MPVAHIQQLHTVHDRACVIDIFGGDKRMALSSYHICAELGIGLYSQQLQHNGTFNTLSCILLI